jgi:hypothetical protein
MSRINDFIDTLDLGVGFSYRCNCPECGGKNTFTVTNDNGNVLYNCYKNSCRVAGSIHRDMDVFTIKAKLMQHYAVHTPETYEKALQETFNQSPYLTRMKPANADVKNFLSKWNINSDDVLYDIRQDRIVFPVHTRSGNMVDAVGRAITNRQPKWLRYAASPVPYTHGKGKTVVIVEDAISAYTVGELVGHKATGLALLGTQLTDFHKWYIGNYFNNAIVSLDPDARDKTLAMTKELRAIMNTFALNTQDDLKYANEDDMKKLEALL